MTDISCIFVEYKSRKNIAIYEKHIIIFLQEVRNMREAFAKGVGFTLGIFVGMTIINMITGPINVSTESKDKEESQ